MNIAVLSPNDLALARWTQREMPGLYKAMALFTPNMRRLLLNKLTGLNVTGDDFIDKSCLRFLNALQAMTKEERQEIERKARNGELS